MVNKKLDELIVQIENYLECWKQFNHYLSLARTKKFAQEDENQFLEIKSVLAQELEMIISGIEFSNPSKDEVHSLLGGSTSLLTSPPQSQSINGSSTNTVQFSSGRGYGACGRWAGAWAGSHARAV